MSDLPLTITDAARALRARELTSVELTTALLERADRLDPLLGVFITRMDESALAAAAAADADFARGIDRGPLQGIPIGLKDILSTDDAPTTAQSLVMDPEWSARGDGPAVRRLRAAGAVIVGKNTTHEFACGAPDHEKPFPIPRNPWNPEHHTGGSSAGTGGGIAAGLFLGGLGTDTGGSVRGPAAYCGITGLKPTFGRIPKSGCTQNGFSLDHIGPMARSAWDTAAILGVVAGHDPSDINAARWPVTDFTAGLDGNIKGMRIGVIREGFLDGVPETTRARFEDAVAVLSDAGAEIREVRLPHYDKLVAANFVNNTSEKAGIYLRRLRERWNDWGRYTRVGNASFGLFLTPADYIQALRWRRFAQQAVAELLSECQVLLSITAKDGAPRIADMGYGSSLLEGATRTGIWSMVGLPTLAVPMGFSDKGLPLSFQVTGRPFDEATVFKVGDAYQRSTDWHLRLPPVLTQEPAAA